MNKKTTEEFINQSKTIHKNKYDYSLVTYKASKTNVDIICPIHGIFSQRPNDHLCGKGCPRCYDNRRGKTLLLTTEEFIKKAKEVHSNKYDYSKSVYTNTRTKIDIICPIHGLFSQKANGHLNGKGCPKCNSSHGENNVREFLLKNNIVFVEQKRFNNCKNKKALPFDFYLKELNVCIEYQGRQHYEPVDVFGGEEGLVVRTKNDLIKRNYCKENNILLVEIKDGDCLDNILDFLLL